MSTGAKAEHVYSPQVDQSHPYLGYELARCVGCGRCVQYAHSIACCDALQLVEIAGAKKMLPQPARRWIDSDCFGCGGCADVCREQAIYPRRIENQPLSGRRQVDSYCPLCSLACPGRYVIDVNGKIVLDAHPQRRNLPICVQARYALEFIFADDRPTEPAIRNHTHLHGTCWKRAIQFTTQQIRAIIDARGPGAIGFVLNPSLPMEDISAVVDFASRQVGVERIFFLPDIPKFRYDEIDLSDMLAATQAASDVAIVNLAGEPIVESLPLRAAVTRLVRAGAVYVSCDPSGRGNAADSLQSNGSGAIDPVDFLGALAKRISGDGNDLGHDPDLRSILKKLLCHARCLIVVPERRLCEDEERIGKLLRFICANDSRFRCLIRSPYPHSTALAEAIRRCHPDIRVAAADELRAGLVSGEICGLYVAGADPVRELAGGKRMVRAFQELEFLAVHDSFLTQSARIADIVMPSPTWLETRGHYVGPAGQRRYSANLLNAPGNVLLIRQVMSTLSDELPPMATRRTAPALPNRQTDVPPCPATNRQADGFGKVRLMLTGSPWHTHNGELTRRTALLMLQNCDPLEISPEDAVIFGLVDGGSAVVGSDNGKIIVPVVVSGTLQPGWVRLSNYFSQTCAQVLWGSEDTMSTPLPVTLRPCGPADDPDKMLTDDQIAYVKLQRYRTDDVPEPSPV